ncbi:hypothetical protein ACOSP7_030522 [Xanthoceras sorbifolium]|uniref:PGG domain-containing protein n=1 Tax=Xanthoceras sorbifolium TaxID=99658 RepID=A0ABQ8H272_9ROSI|nr:hypothetical protein JRO89_XS15G0146600 [Xanthoceras sorbifolium]
MDLEFLRALKCGNAVRIMELAKEKPDLFLGRSPQGNTALHIASRSSLNKCTVVQEIINKQPSLLYERNDRDETPLHTAAATGHLNVVKLFGEKAKSTDDETGRKNSLMRMQDNEGNTALHIAVKYGHSQVVEELTSVDPEPILYINRAGQSPLSIAIDEKWTDIARWIIRKNPNSLNYEGSNQLTLLHSAVIRHNFDIMIEILSTKKELVSKVDTYQRNVLHYAAASGHVRISERLLKEDVSLAYKCDENGHTPLHLATKNGRFLVTKLLVKDYPNAIEMLDNNKRNILHLAARHGRNDIALFILNLPEKDDLLNAADKDGNTPLHLAAMYFYNRMVSILSGHRKLNIEATNHEQQTALAIAQSSKIKATQNKRYLTLRAMNKAYKNRGPDPEGIIATECLDEKMGTTAVRNEQDEIEKAKKLAEILLMLTTLVAAFTFTAALTIPADYRYKDSGSPQYKFLNFDLKYNGFDFEVFACSIAISSASCLSAAATICWLFWRLSHHHEYFMKILPVTLVFTLIGLASMAVAFLSGLFVVLSNNQNIPSKLVWSVCTVTVCTYVVVPCYIILFVYLKLNNVVVWFLSRT